ncbi:MAG: methyltransferase domain-containing protein [Bacteroidota bacterium]
MNYKLLFSTYRNRYRFVQSSLDKYVSDQKVSKALNLGTGEGDYDPMIAPYCHQLIGCDINEGDIEFAQQLNADIPQLSYQVENALRLSFKAEEFSLLISVEVMEHVGDPEQMTREIGRVLRPGGLAIITFPQTNFPWTYDPINKLAGKRLIGQGAYAFGHDYLVNVAAFKSWAERYGLEVLEERALSGHFVGLSEMYWTGWIQRIFKDNSGNANSKSPRKGKLRPSRKAPLLVGITDFFTRFDYWLFGRSKQSVGRGFVLRKRD